MITNWEITREDHDLLVEVAERALRKLTNYPDDKRSLVMDLCACHSNGCPLDFAGLLNAPMLDFSHDIYGIRQHINRDTGQLEDCFTPRFALANHVSEATQSIMTFKDLKIEHIFRFVEGGTLHEKTSDTTAREISSVKVTKPFTVRPDIEVIHS